jgi:hypothetical protein
MAAVMPVRIGPGQMQFTVTPWLPSSTAIAFVKPTTPCLAATSAHHHHHHHHHHRIEFSAM